MSRHQKESSYRRTQGWAGGKPHSWHFLRFSVIRKFEANVMNLFQHGSCTYAYGQFWCWCCEPNYVCGTYYSSKHVNTLKQWIVTNFSSWQTTNFISDSNWPNFADRYFLVVGIVWSKTSSRGLAQRSIKFQCKAGPRKSVFGVTYWSKWRVKLFWFIFKLIFIK